MSPATKPMKTARRAAGFPRVAVGATPEDESPTAAVQAAPTAAQPPTEIAPPAQLPAAQTSPERSNAEATAPPAKSDRRPSNGAAGRKTPDASRVGATKPGGHRHQTNFRLYESEINYLKRLQREFEDDEIKTDVTELVHAVIYATRRGEIDPLETLRRWRRDLNEF